MPYMQGRAHGDSYTSSRSLSAFPSGRKYFYDICQYVYISKKAKKSLLRAGEGILVRKNEEKWGRGGREEDYMVISIIISTKEVL
jgi:hypothetical protein